jgi:hypothetical protein
MLNADVAHSTDVTQSRPFEGTIGRSGLKHRFRAVVPAGPLSWRVHQRERRGQLATKHPPGRRTIGHLSSALTIALDESVVHTHIVT